jgi:signal transduction histidine kinase
MFGPISLRTQLVLTLAGCTLLTAVVLATLAYERIRGDLEARAREAVVSAARNRAEVVSSVVAAQQQHAAGFLTTVMTLCAENTRPDRIAIEIDCAQRAVNELRIAERATAAMLTFGSRRIASAGRNIEPRLPIPSPLARIVNAPSGLQYAIRAEAGRAAVRLQFPMADLYAHFGAVPGLGSYGEVLMRTADGAPLSPARFASGKTIGMDVERPYPCPAGQNVPWIDVDYRGVQTLHGIHRIADFSGGLCADAHMAYDEVVEPAHAVLVDLITRGGVLAAAGVLLAIVSAWFIASPVRRLAVAAHALEGGDFDASIRIAGPLEVRRLARSFATMALAVRELVTREQRARHEAESASRAKDEFLAVISHELRTPLTATLGWIRLLRAGTLSPAKAEQALAAIERSTGTQAQLIEDLLDISRIVAGRLELQRREVSFADVVRTAVESERPAADAKGVKLESDASAPAVVWGDPLRLQQIVTNLIVNAVKFTPSGGRVVVRLRATNGDIELTVTDTGIGIPAAFLPYLFEPFRQADAGSTRAHGGLGLGLSIVQHLVKLHGGTVAAASQGSDRGAVFTVTLPKPSAAPVVNGAPAAALTAHARHDTSSPRLAAVRVLLVEDDDSTRQILAVVLEEAGARVDAAASADEARAYLAKRDYRAIISDLAMPREDGFALIRALRSAHNNVPAIALTALARPEDAAQAYASGFQMFLRKPVTPDQLVSAVAAIALT